MGSDPRIWPLHRRHSHLQKMLAEVTAKCARAKKYYEECEAWAEHLSQVRAEKEQRVRIVAQIQRWWTSRNSRLMLSRRQRRRRKILRNGMMRRTNFQTLSAQRQEPGNGQRLRRELAIRTLVSSSKAWLLCELLRNSPRNTSRPR